MGDIKLVGYNAPKGTYKVSDTDFNEFNNSNNICLTYAQCKEPITSLHLVVGPLSHLSPALQRNS